MPNSEFCMQANNPAQRQIRTIDSFVEELCWLLGGVYLSSTLTKKMVLCRRHPPPATRSGQNPEPPVTAHVASAPHLRPPSRGLFKIQDHLVTPAAPSQRHSLPPDVTTFQSKIASNICTTLGGKQKTTDPPATAAPPQAIAHEYNSGFNPLQLHCWFYDVLQRIVPSCSDLPLGVSAVPEVLEIFSKKLSFRKLRSRVTVFLREPATISFATRAVTLVATAPKSTTSGLRPRGLPVLAALSDMGNSANVNPPAKCSRADRTPIRSSERSPTGGGIPSGSSATHSETMCDIDEMSLAASEGDWHPTLTNPSSTPSGRVQDEAEVMSSVLTRGYVVPEASEISRDVCFPATQDPFDIGSGSCAPTGGTPEVEIEGETSTPSATFSREGTLTGRPQGEQHRAQTFTATALIGRYGTAPASSPKPDPFQGLAPTYSQSFSVLPGCTWFFPGVLHSTGLCPANPTSRPGEA
ncbi:hypothetical protein E1301_Tti023904 [Triplophysa tibetana]|uniref:Uncharacterized protein n=1 Tax=Triplophysa tibetana TaxID=1572043 RepID=A0A5A9P2F7_9TELE|nr:hypothetical protein E1301_Tti023904 [Triplophysa tibetana]